MNKKDLKKLTFLSVAVFIIIITLARGTAPAKADIELLPITDSGMESIELVLEQTSDEEDTESNAALLSGLSAGTQTVQVYLHATGKTVTLPLEEYITGVLAAEMPALFEPEALKAQAVAARTYLYHRLENGKCGRGGADICTDSNHCQAWLSAAQQKSLWGENYTAYHEKIQTAVYQTAGKLLTYDGQPINALYHAVSGGQTEDCAAVFSQSLPYLISVSSPGEQNDSNYQTEVTFTCAKLVSLLNSSFSKAKLTVSQLKSQCKIISYTESGRADQVKIGKATVDATDLRLALGLKSTLFTIQFSGDTVTFHVKGYGHGVGMSQRGANTMAQQGSTYQEILAHYYPGTTLQS